MLSCFSLSLSASSKQFPGYLAEASTWPKSALELIRAKWHKPAA